MHDCVLSGRVSCASDRATWEEGKNLKDNYEANRLLRDPNQVSNHLPPLLPSILTRPILISQGLREEPNSGAPEGQGGARGGGEGNLQRRRRAEGGLQPRAQDGEGERCGSMPFVTRRPHRVFCHREGGTAQADITPASDRRETNRNTRGGLAGRALGAWGEEKHRPSTND